MSHCSSAVAVGADPAAVTLQGESTLVLLRQSMNEKMVDANPNWYDSNVDANLVTESDILDIIIDIRKLDAEEDRRKGFNNLSKDVTRQYLFIQGMDKDTRPGTEREKD